MDVANVVIFYSRESEGGRHGPVVVEAPLAYVPVPACLQLAGYYDLLSLAVYGNAPEVATVLDSKPITREQLISDTEELLDLLRETFGQRRSSSWAVSRRVLSSDC